MLKPVILCVDDEPLILETLKTELRNRFAGRFTYETAMDGEEALALIEELVAEGITIVLIVSDWLMPGIRGDELLETVHSRWPAIRAILVTGQADRTAIDRVLQGSWASHVIPKPWRSEELLSVVEQLCATAP
jgi:CheY-like chemotaxis protein